MNPQTRTTYWVATTSPESVSADGRTARVDAQLLGPFGTWDQAHAQTLKSRDEGLRAEIVTMLEK